MRNGASKRIGHLRGVHPTHCGRHDGQLSVYERIVVGDGIRLRRRRMRECETWPLRYLAPDTLRSGYTLPPVCNALVRSGFCVSQVRSVPARWGLAFVTM